MQSGNLAVQTLAPGRIYHVSPDSPKIPAPTPSVVILLQVNLFGKPTLGSEDLMCSFKSPADGKRDGQRFGQPLLRPSNSRQRQRLKGLKQRVAPR